MWRKAGQLHLLQGDSRACQPGNSARSKFLTRMLLANQCTSSMSAAICADSKPKACCLHRRQMRHLKCTYQSMTSWLFPRKAVQHAETAPFSLL